MTDNQSLFEQAVAAARQKDFATARALLKQLLKQEPGNLNAWLLAAHVVETRSDAIGCYRRALQLDPGHAYARQKLSELEGQPPAAAQGGTSTARPVFPPSGPAVSQNRPAVRQPEAVRLEPGKGPQEPASRPPAPKPKKGFGMVALGGLLLGVSCLAIIVIALFWPGGSGSGSAQPTPSAEELFAVVYQNARAANEENIAAYMATIHPDSPMYDETQAALVEIFTQYDLEFRYYDLQVTRLRPTEARLDFSLSTRKINGPEFRNNVVIGTMTLRLIDGRWLIYDQDVDDIQY